MTFSSLPADAVGLGLRRGLLPALQSAARGAFDFLEAAPENWMSVGGALGEAFADVAARQPLVCHGLSLSLGGPAPLDEAFLLKLRRFLDAHRCVLYSEHLSACSDEQGQLYDLLPLPFNAAAAAHVAERIRRTQDLLGRRIAIENVSYYATLDPHGMGEAEFINTVLERADCDLLLDVNNIVVNATNHGYDARAFLHAMPASRIAYLHVAGHHDDAPDLKIDTHGAAVSSPVWALLEETYRHFGPRPTLLERDFNLPPFDELLQELEGVRARIGHVQGQRAA